MRTVGRVRGEVCCLLLFFNFEEEWCLFADLEVSSVSIRGQ